MHGWQTAGRRSLHIGDNDILVLNDTALITISNDLSYCYLYHAMKKKWEKWFELPELDESVYTMTVDRDNHKFYIFTVKFGGKNDRKMNGQVFSYIFDDYLQCHKQEKYTIKYDFAFNNVESIQSMYIKNELHLFIREKLNDNSLITRHIIWNSKKNKIELNEDNVDYDKVIYVKSKRNIFSFCLKNRKLRTFSLKNQKWHTTATKQKFKTLENSGFCLTSNEKYIMIFGGYYKKVLRNYMYSATSISRRYDCNEIYLFNVEKKSLRRNAFTCPFDGKCKAAPITYRLTNDFLFEYFKMSYLEKQGRKSNDDIPILPNDIMEIIVNMYGIQRFVYLIYCGTNAHYLRDLASFKLH